MASNMSLQTQGVGDDDDDNDDDDGNEDYALRYALNEHEHLQRDPHSLPLALSVVHWHHCGMQLRPLACCDPGPRSVFASRGFCLVSVFNTMQDVKFSDAASENAPYPIGAGNYLLCFTITCSSIIMIMIVIFI